jgi:hypothetical protein
MRQATRLAIAAGLLAAVAACSYLTPAKVQTATANAKVLFTEAAQQACQGQSAANAAEAIAKALGNADAVTAASAVSAALGVGCTWTQLASN